VTEIFTLLSAGGDVATMALLYVMWRFDRRLLTLEIKLARCRDCGDRQGQAEPLRP